MTTELEPLKKSDPLSRTGRLLLNGREVGSVVVRKHEGSWGFGEFLPDPAFSEFAHVFGRWSLLMHADDVGEKLSEAASEELRATEYEIDTLRAKLLIEDDGKSHPLRQVNIDGPLIEWKE